jgi:hypothetical protein
MDIQIKVRIYKTQDKMENFIKLSRKIIKHLGMNKNILKIIKYPKY